MVTTVAVEECDIKNGHPGSSMFCPVALALCRWTGYHAEVGAAYATLRNAFRRVEFKLPEAITTWIETFDAGDEVKPITFKVDL